MLHLLFPSSTFQTSKNQELDEQIDAIENYLEIENTKTKINYQSTVKYVYCRDTDWTNNE
jgi:hypothetical protein